MHYFNSNLIRRVVKRNFSQTVFFSSQTTCYINQLKMRTVLKLQGPDTYNYLQSMMTNDVRKTQSFSSLYALLLNPNGRVLYDIILYKINDNECLVEYDATGVKYLQKHLLMYRLRKDVKIQVIKDKKVWAIYNHPTNVTDSFELNIWNDLKSIKDVVMYTKDPRNSLLGVRAITEEDTDLYSLFKQCSSLNLIQDQDDYRIHRYKLGIGEGVTDHPPGNCLPFETNVDLLNGVSFTKGCYIGQEMTAKSNFVFSIRKRLMPVTLDKMDSYPVFPPECNIVNNQGQKVGRLRGHVGQHGLALLKFEECAKAQSLLLEGFDIKLDATRPTWWPSNLKSDANEHIYSL